MPTARLIREIRFGGGWATDYGPVFPSAEDIIVVPWLMNADNIYFELDGGIHKMGGGVKLNSTVISGSSDVMGIFDYWRSGTGGSSTQKRIAHAGTVVYKEDLDGVWDSLITGLESGKIPCYGIYNDILVLTSSSSVDVPKKYDQTTAANLGGTPPNFDFFTIHKNRAWAAGVDSNPSRLYYSALDNIEDWTGAGSGSIDISSNDGGVITGLWGEHKNVLWVFKGPQKLSIHYITGSSPSDFARVPFARGVGASNHNGIVAFGDDLAFHSILGVHSLATTADYGDFKESFLSFPFSSYWQENLALGRLSFSQAAHYSKRGLVLWTLTTSGQTENDLILGMDYRFTPPRWVRWFQPSAASLATVVNNNIFELWAGTYDGFTLRLDQRDRNMADTSYTARATLPYINFGSSHFSKYAAKVFVGFNPGGAYNMILGYTRDNNLQQTATISQAGSEAILAPAPAGVNEFELDTSVLSGSYFATRSADLEGEFQDIQLEVLQAGSNQDMEVHSIGIHADRGGVVTE